MIEEFLRKSLSVETKEFCPLAEDDSFVEVTEWRNGEGWDITIDERQYHLTEGELDAINYLVQTIRHNVNKREK